MLIFISTLVAGCAGSAQPYFYEGRYYMAGDSNCTRWNWLSSTRIMCSDSDGNQTGYRDAMTNQQLEMYRHNQTMRSNSYNNNNNNNSGPTWCNRIGSQTFCY